MKNNIIAFFDYNCPFCYIGFSIIEELKSQFNINCIYQPCELYPSILSNGILKEDILNGYDIDNIYKKLRIIGKRNSIEFGNLDKKYNSHKALLLAEFAKENNKFIEFSKYIYKDYYNFDRNISDDFVLKSIFYKLNLDFDYATSDINILNLESKLIKSMELKNKLNIDLLPTYIINDDTKLSGILTKNSFLKALK